MVDSASARHSRNRVEEVWTESTAKEPTEAIFKMNRFVSTGAITLQRRFTAIGRRLVSSSALRAKLKPSSLSAGFRKCFSFR